LFFFLATIISIYGYFEHYDLLITSIQLFVILCAYFSYRTFFWRSYYLNKLGIKKDLIINIGDFSLNISKKDIVEELYARKKDIADSSLFDIIYFKFIIDKASSFENQKIIRKSFEKNGIPPLSENEKTGIILKLCFEKYFFENQNRSYFLSGKYITHIFNPKSLFFKNNNLKYCSISHKEIEEHYSNDIKFALGRVIPLTKNENEYLSYVNKSKCNIAIKKLNNDIFYNLVVLSLWNFDFKKSFDDNFELIFDIDKLYHDLSAENKVIELHEYTEMKSNNIEKIEFNSLFNDISSFKSLIIGNNDFFIILNDKKYCINLTQRPFNSPEIIS
tara:strand:- start:10529 stop:11524 length:996 start_codon:yes stop_codon:yes gene_type:complete